MDPKCFISSVVTSLVLLTLTGALNAQGVAPMPKALVTPGRTVETTALGNSLSFGSGLVPLGDMNGDGVDEVIVGAPGAIGGAGAVYYFDGADAAVSGFQSTPIMPPVIGPTFSQVPVISEFGASVLVVGDLDGDQFPDYAVGAPGSVTLSGLFNAWSDVGAVFFFSGMTGAPIPDVANPTNPRAEAGVTDGARFGEVMVSMTDLGSDGIDEIAVSAPGDTGTGKVSILNVAIPALVTDIVPTGGIFSSGGAPLRFGHSVEFISQFTPLANSSVPTIGLAIGAPGDDSGLPTGGMSASIDNGTVEFYRVTPSTTQVRWVTRRRGDGSGDRFGSAISDAGDLDQAGFSEVLVGAENGNSAAFPGQRTGYVRILPGNNYSSPISPLFPPISGGAPGDQFGADVCFLGDVNGDPMSVEFAIGAPQFGPTPTGPGYIEVWSVNLAPGGGLTRILSVQGEAVGDSFGSRVCNGGDLNGNGQDDILVAARTSDASNNQTSFSGVGSINVVLTSARYPGTDDNLDVVTAVSDAGVTPSELKWGPGEDQSAINLGKRLTFSLASPGMGPSLEYQPVFFFVDLVPSSTGPGPGPIYVTTNSPFSLLPPGPGGLLPALIPGTNFNVDLPAVVPPGSLTGMSLVFQGAVISGLATNGFFAISDAREIMIKP